MNWKIVVPTVQSSWASGSRRGAILTDGRIFVVDLIDTYPSWRLVVGPIPLNEYAPEPPGEHCQTTEGE